MTKKSTTQAPKKSKHKKVFIKFNESIFLKSDEYSEHLRSVISASPGYPYEVAYMNKDSSMVSVLNSKKNEDGPYLMLDPNDYTILTDDQVIYLLNNNEEMKKLLSDNDDYIKGLRNELEKTKKDKTWIIITVVEIGLLLVTIAMQYHIMTM